MEIVEYSAFGGEASGKASLSIAAYQRQFTSDYDYTVTDQVRLRFYPHEEPFQRFFAGLSNLPDTIQFQQDLEFSGKPNAYSLKFLKSVNPYAPHGNIALFIFDSRSTKSLDDISPLCEYCKELNLNVPKILISTKSQYFERNPNITVPTIERETICDLMRKYNFLEYWDTSAKHQQCRRVAIFDGNEYKEETEQTSCYVFEMFAHFAFLVLKTRYPEAQEEPRRRRCIIS